MGNARRTNWRFWLSATLLLAFWGCSSEPDVPGGATDDGYIHLFFSKTETRADLNPDGSGQFTEGDRIGLFVDGSDGVRYCELTYRGGEWTPRLRRADFGPGSLDFSAHYPAFTDGTSTDADFRIAADQSGDGMTQSDLLFARTTLDEGQNRAVMTFGHVMHRLKIELSGSTENVSILARSVGDGTADLLTGEMIATGSDMQWITPAKSSDGSLEVVIFPKSAEPYRSGEGLLKITSGGKVSYYMAPAQLESGAPLETFEPGKQTSVRLQLKSNTEQEWANRKVWVDGIREPEEGAWLQLFPETYSTYYLPWKPEHGWYDCDKLNPTSDDNGVPDGMMCWSATASNLLHWWIAQNVEYVEKYDYRGPDYTYPLDKPQESDIFQCFIDSFDDDAGYGDAGINWFIHGIRPSYPAYDKPENPAGYFKDVFPEGVKLGQNYGGLSKEVFNTVMKDALKNRKGIGFSRGNVRSSHVMTIWGGRNLTRRATSPISISPTITTVMTMKSIMWVA